MIGIRKTAAQKEKDERKKLKQLLERANKVVKHIKGADLVYASDQQRMTLLDNYYRSLLVARADLVKKYGQIGELTQPVDIEIRQVLEAIGRLRVSLEQPAGLGKIR